MKTAFVSVLRKKPHTLPGAVQKAPYYIIIRPHWDALPERMSKHFTEYYDQVKYPGRTLLPGRIVFAEK